LQAELVDHPATERIFYTCKYLLPTENYLGNTMAAGTMPDSLSRTLPPGGSDSIIPAARPRRSGRRGKAQPAAAFIVGAGLWLN